MIVPEPKCDGAFHVTVTCSLADVTPEIVGTVGKVEATGEVNEGIEVPITFLAEMRNS